MPPRRRYERDEFLTLGVEMRCRWDVERDIVSFAVVLVAMTDGRWTPVELFDCSHGDRNDRHRYTIDGGKGPAEPFHHGSPSEAYRAAIDLIQIDFERMIERWER